MIKRLALLNTLSVLFVIVVNYASQMGFIGETTIGEMSNRYTNLFTPAGYAFAIWGVIYVSLLGYVIFQIRRAFFSNKSTDFIVQTGYWFLIANVCNVGWVVAFTYGYIGLSVLLMAGILISLGKIIVNTNMERWDAPIEIIAFVWWPICLYAGWIAVASIANTAAFLVKIDVAGSLLNQTVWTMVLITTAVFINMIMINLRNMREFACVGAWALFAIFWRHKDEMQAIAYYALIAAIILIVSAGIHALKNRETNPINKLKQRLNS